MSLHVYNLLLRRSDGTTEPLEFTAQSPSNAATHGTRRVEMAAKPSVEAVLVLEANMVWIPRYEEWLHLLPEHVLKNLPTYEFSGYTPMATKPGKPSPKPLDPPHVADTELHDPEPPVMDRAQAKAAGFTGNTCNDCGSLQMVRNGTCEKCQSCGTTTGCS